ncbi:MAG: hypothetical protein WDZ49_13760, partial [Litorilinea sp.]
SIDRSTLRLLGEHAGQRFWLAENEDGEICVIDYVETGQVWMSGIGCASVEEFAQHGVFIVTKSTVAGAEHFSAAVAIPNGYAEDATLKLPEAVVMPNLIIFDAPEAIEAAIAQHGDAVLLEDNSPIAQPELSLNLTAPFTASSITAGPPHVDEIAVGVPELDALLALLQRNELSLEYGQFSPRPCTHQTGLGGPPKCAEDEAEGTPIDVLPIMAQSGSYLRRSQAEDAFVTTAATVEVVYRVIEDGPGEGWPRGEYGVIVHEADAFPPVTTFFVANGKIVRITAHMGKSLDVVRAEVNGDILYDADAISP